MGLRRFGEKLASCKNKEEVRIKLKATLTLKNFLVKGKVPCPAETFLCISYFFFSHYSFTAFIERFVKGRHVYTMFIHLFFTKNFITV